MRRRLGNPRALAIVYAGGTLAIILAVGLQLLGANLPGGVLVAEGLLLLVGMGYAGFAIAFEERLQHLDTRGRLLMTAVNLGLTTAIIGVAAPWVGAPLPLAFGVLCMTILAGIIGDPNRRDGGRRPTVPTAAATVALVAIWLRLRLVGQGDPVDVVTWGLMMGGFGILVEVHWRHGRQQLEARMAHLAAMATVARRLGGTTDLPGVARAVLEAYQQTYPHLEWGGILLYQPETGELRSLPVALVAGQVGPMPAGGVAVRPGEGLAGEAFVVGEVRHRSSASQNHADDGGRGRDVQAHVDNRVGTLMSTIAAPLRSADGEMIGVVTLASASVEFQWTGADAQLVQGIADQAGVAIERGRLYDEQQRNALSDHLTTIANRRAFEGVIDNWPTDLGFAILAIDLDNLKSINDKHGHEAGDRVLRLVAQCLRFGLRPEDTVARIGGDEFAAFLPSTDAPAAAEIANRLTLAIQGVPAPGGSARISVGCVAGLPGEDPRVVWSRADEALYRAKTAGRDRVEVLAGDGLGAERRSRHWVELMPELLRSRRISAVYQPIVRLADGHTVAYEALARPSGTFPSSSVEGLFAAALTMGLEWDLDWMCRRAALESAKHLGEDVLLFMNVGIPALLNPLHDVDQMMLLLRSANRDPSEVVLELSEREAVRDLRRMAEVLGAYRDRGFRFALDDVGEGHSTIEVLAAATPEYIKIARSLTRTAASPGQRAAIEGLVAFARGTGATIVAEGIESQEDIDIMSRLGVHLGQGYRLGRPRAAEPAATLRVDRATA